MSSANIDAAIFSLLANDATLTSLAPGGVFRSTSPPNISSPFVIVDLVEHTDEHEMGSATPALEDVRYQVKAVDNSKSMLGAQAAADRIHTLLNGATLTITGYTSLNCVRDERIAYIEVDTPGFRFAHAGGIYHVMVDPT